ncbi:hypothetical protein F5144DRAFT_82298 [Chaetomium tenue]|uniref:Uncharacterized protein n=1 Tax=Chaetomium tenue TaxID=1854479 RepID=A0ACB7PS49_9PEZI|nr:hypothetical protein F5144DRAFT_82298 [Chaetomium globosum]
MANDIEITEKEDIVRHKEEASIAADTGAVRSKVWFKHGPQSDSDIRHIKAIQLIADSHNQRFVDNRYEGNWT